jgi:hypothetical protein
MLSSRLEDLDVDPQQPSARMKSSDASSARRLIDSALSVFDLVQN